MAKKDMEPAAAEAAEMNRAETAPAAGRRSAKKPEGCAAGFYCYIGPNLKKLIQTGTVYRGTREDALARAAEAIKAEPLVKTLIVSGDALPAALVRVKTPGNALYTSYRKLAGKEGK